MKSRAGSGNNAIFYPVTFPDRRYITVFYDIYARLCAEKGVSPSRAAVDMGFYRSSVSYWKNKGGAPTRDGLRKMAEYFGVSEDIFAGAGDGDEAAKGEPRKTSGHKKAAAKTAERSSAPDKSKIFELPVQDAFEKSEPAQTGNMPSRSTRISEEQTESAENLHYADSGNIKLRQPDDEAAFAGSKSADFISAMEQAIEYIGEIKQDKPEKLCDRIKLLRKQQGLSVDYVAKAVGVDRRTYLLWESGEISEIRRYKLGKLAGVFGTSIDYIMGKDDMPDVVRGVGEPDIRPFVELIRNRGECLALLLMARDMSREDVELTISFMRSLKSE